MTGARTARLLIACQDRPGIVAAVSRFLFEHGANITDSAQHSTDPQGGQFFMRMEFELAEPSQDLGSAFDREVGRAFAMDWSLGYADERKRLAILASREDHCLLDLLWRLRRGSLDAEVTVVISNHTHMREDVEGFGVPFEHVPVTPETKPAAEARMLELLAGSDLVVLARYMQILSGAFLDALEAPVINIHHSFLPAFAGADPYRRARERGVKIIGATAHYVTEELDAGPIIEQDVRRVTHESGVEDLVHAGEDVERLVMSRAVRMHLEDRVLLDGSTTIVF